MTDDTGAPTGRRIGAGGKWEWIIMLLIMAPFLAVGIAICVTDVISHIWGNAAILTSLSTMGRIVWAEHRSRRNPRRELSSRRPISADSATKDA